MNRVLQGEDAITIAADAGRIWEILVDGARLPEWASMVKHTTGGRECVDAVRHCEVEFDGRPGRVTERCVEFVDRRRIAWVMTADSFGFGKMFIDMGFGFTLEPAEGGATRLRNDTFYQPRNLLASIMSRLMMRRKFRQLRRGVLENLKPLAEAI
jgi:uncharacterized protein YndB with AHSA1/START domain